MRRRASSRTEEGTREVEARAEEEVVAEREEGGPCARRLASTGAPGRAPRLVHAPAGPKGKRLCMDDASFGRQDLVVPFWDAWNAWRGLKLRGGPR